MYDFCDFDFFCICCVKIECVRAHPAALESTVTVSGATSRVTLGALVMASRL